jgi:hypothetical protein
MNVDFLPQFGSGSSLWGPLRWDHLPLNVRRTPRPRLPLARREESTLPAAAWLNPS